MKVFRILMLTSCLLTSIYSYGMHGQIKADSLLESGDTLYVTVKITKVESVNNYTVITGIDACANRGVRIVLNDLYVNSDFRIGHLYKFTSFDYDYPIGVEDSEIVGVDISNVFCWDIDPHTTICIDRQKVEKLYLARDYEPRETSISTIKKED